MAYIASMALVLCMELDVVLDRRLYPRALLTPMSDRVELTPADRLAYTHLVETQSLKGFQNVDVSFDRDGRHGTARRRPRTPSRSRGSTSTR
ncbi:hypothetical protein [Agilicoccus flavus]|uniref:hypothetical protein n=1 Tax=Agilicoccus flavus TaxID=2775968 RepID=UPI001CF6D419|nr:hypothetical protein [Agilicoccus flavus]